MYSASCALSAVSLWAHNDARRSNAGDKARCGDDHVLCGRHGPGEEYPRRKHMLRFIAVAVACTMAVAAYGDDNKEEEPKKIRTIAQDTLQRRMRLNPGFPSGGQEIRRGGWPVLAGHPIN
jgi:hypothetical protein